MKNNNIIYYKTTYKSPLGELTIASDTDNITGVWLEGQKYFEASIKNNTILKNNNLKVFIQTKEWLNRYFNKERPEISEIPMAPAGTHFQLDVWNILCKIPYGKTMTYKEIAEILANKYNKKSMSAQAVGGAVGHNPISIIIPCHRVIGSNGKLTGYAGGLNNKIKLLKLENEDFKEKI